MIIARKAFDHYKQAQPLSIDEIVKIAPLKEGTTKKSIRILEEVGLLIIDRDKNPGRGRKNKYSVNPELFEEKGSKNDLFQKGSKNKGLFFRAFNDSTQEVLISSPNPEIPGQADKQPETQVSNKVIQIDQNADSEQKLSNKETRKKKKTSPPAKRPEGEHILFDEIWKAFEKGYGKIEPKFASREAKALWDLIDMAKVKSPDAWSDFLKTVVATYASMKTARRPGEKYYWDHPFKASTVCSSGIWSYILNKMMNTKEPTPEELAGLVPIGGIQ